MLARTGWGSYRNRPSPRAHHRPVRRQGQARLPRTTSRPNTGPETTPTLRDDHMTSIALPVRLRASFQTKTALARRSHLPRRSLLDPHHALRYAERCHGRNLPWDRDDPVCVSLRCTAVQTPLKIIELFAGIGCFRLASDRMRSQTLCEAI